MSHNPPDLQQGWEEAMLIDFYSSQQTTHGNPHHMRDQPGNKQLCHATCMQQMLMKLSHQVRNDHACNCPIEARRLSANIRNEV